MAGKRANVRPKRDGWEARAWIDGKRRSFYAKTQAEAVARMTRAKADADRGMARPREGLTVENHLDEWLEFTVKPGVRYRTYVRYRDLSTMYLIPAVGRVKLVDLVPGQVTRMLASLLASGLSEGTVKHCRNTLRAALKVAQQDYGLPTNAAGLARMPKSDKPPFRPEVVTPDEAKALLATFAGSRLEPLVLFSAATGLRQGEMLALRWRDIDYERRIIHVEHAVDIQEGGVRVLARTKTEKSRRPLALKGSAERALAIQKAITEDDRLLAGAAWEEMDLVFPGPTGGIRDACAVSRNFREHQRRRGMVPIRWHALRRVFAALLQDSGVPLAQVRDLLGHSTISVTEHYAYTMPQSLTDAMSAVDDVLGGGTPGADDEDQLADTA